MIKRVQVLALFLLVFWGKTFSQHLSHQVLVPAAGLAVLKTLDYSQTIGETAIEIICCSGFEFTQGFQQPSVSISPEIIPAGTGVEVYPNPAIDYFNVKLFGDVARKFKIDLISVNGTIVSTATINFITTYFYIRRIEVDNLLRGLYYLRVVSMDGLINRTFKVEKM